MNLLPSSAHFSQQNWMALEDKRDHTEANCVPSLAQRICWRSCASGMAPYCLISVQHCLISRVCSVPGTSGYSLRETEAAVVTEIKGCSVFISC